MTRTWSPEDLRRELLRFEEELRAACLKESSIRTYVDRTDTFPALAHRRVPASRSAVGVACGNGGDRTNRKSRPAQPRHGRRPLEVDTGRRASQRGSSSPPPSPRRGRGRCRSPAPPASESHHRARERARPWRGCAGRCRARQPPLIPSAPRRSATTTRHRDPPRPRALGDACRPMQDPTPARFEWRCSHR